MSKYMTQKCCLKSLAVFLPILNYTKAMMTMFRSRLKINVKNTNKLKENTFTVTAHLILATFQ